MKKPAVKLTRGLLEETAESIACEIDDLVRDVTGKGLSAIATAKLESELRRLIIECCGE